MPSTYPPEIQDILLSAQAHGTILHVDWDPDGGFWNTGYLAVVIMTPAGQGCINSGSGVVTNGKFSWQLSTAGPCDITQYLPEAVTA